MAREEHMRIRDDARTGSLDPKEPQSTTNHGPIVTEDNKEQSEKAHDISIEEFGYAEIQPPLIVGEKETESHASPLEIDLTPDPGPPLDLPQSVASYQIFGTDSQVLEFYVSEGQEVFSEQGKLIHFSTGFNSRLEAVGGLKRCGQTRVRTIYRNDGATVGTIALSGYPGSKIVPIVISKEKHLTVGSYCLLGGASKDMQIEVQKVRKFSFLNFWKRRKSYFFNRITGTGTIFLSCYGTVLERVLESDEEILVNTQSIVAFESSVEYESTFVNYRKLFYTCFDHTGEVIIGMTRLKGPGKLWLQSC